jgi:catechol 2,3-dioxygenase-like lactoylglutathione lyase family enzyme
MQVRKLYHFTLVVEDLVAAEQFYNEIFSPHCFMRGYAPMPLHRDAALLNIADTVVEPMQPFSPPPGETETTIFRYLKRFGPGAHSLALLVSGAEEIAIRFEKAGLRWTDGGLPNHVFPHPKDFPGLLELADFGPNFERFPLPDPRLSPGFNQDYWRTAQPLGIEYTSHYTLVVGDRHDASRRYVDLLDARPLPEQPSMTAGATSSYVAFPDNTVLELAQPDGASSPLEAVLHRIGQSWYGLTFKVPDLDPVEARVAQGGRSVVKVSQERWLLDPARSFGVEHGFTTRALEGDPRAA